jgi:hypothetical protein
MSWRHEEKFMIDEYAFKRLLYSLKPVLHQDPHARQLPDCSENGYRIRSLYFDDAASRGVFEKLSGIDHRHKFRIRIYDNDDSVIRLEKKIKMNSLSRKDSCILNKELVQSLCHHDVEPLFLAHRAARTRSEFDLTGQLYCEWQTAHLRPKVLVDYVRIPFLWPDGRVRITFDRYLSTGYFRQDLWDPDASMKTILPPEWTIMEVKYDAYMPEFIANLINSSGFSQISVSKYVQCALGTRINTWETC